MKIDIKWNCLIILPIRNSQKYRIEFIEMFYRPKYTGVRTVHVCVYVIYLRCTYIKTHSIRYFCVDKNVFLL